MEIELRKMNICSNSLNKVGWRYPSTTVNIFENSRRRNDSRKNLSPGILVDLKSSMHSGNTIKNIVKTNSSRWSIQPPQHCLFMGYLTLIQGAFPCV